MQSTSSTGGGGNAVLGLIVLAMARDQFAHRSAEGPDPAAAQRFITLSWTPVKTQADVRHCVWGRT